jgi:ribosome-binding factor A
VAGKRGRRAGSPTGAHRYPRTARVNQVLREVIADSLERLSADDARLGLLTVTGVDVDPDLRHATVWLSSLSDEAAEVLAEERGEIQGAIGRQVRMKRTPQLKFAVDPAVVNGERIDGILRGLTPAADDPAVDPAAELAPDPAADEAARIDQIIHDLVHQPGDQREYGDHERNP